MQYTKEQTQEIAVISAIMSTDLFDQVYKKAEHTANPGLIGVAHTIANWAIEFYDKYQTTDWLHYDYESVFPMSKNFQVGEMNLSCWDDMVLDYGYYKLEGM